MTRTSPFNRSARAVVAAAIVTVTGPAECAAQPPPEPGGGIDLAVARLLDVAEVRAVVVAGMDGVELQRYRTPSDSGPHNIKSASKSLVALLAGIAIERGVVHGLDAPVSHLLPGYRETIEGRLRDDLTLGHLLTMTAGLETTSGDAYGAWVATADWVRTALTRPAVAPPGERFIYSTGNTHVAAAALAGALDADLAVWARSVLFAPLGITDVRWSRSPTGRVFGGNNLAMRPADLARIASLVAAGGRWAGQQIVSADWIEASARRHAAGWPDRYGAYGIGWWLPASGGMLAVGYGGQFLLVDPELEGAVVVTSTLDGKDPAWDRDVLDRMRAVLDARGHSTGG